MDKSSDNYFLKTSLKPEILCFYNNTGIYISAEKPFVDYRFNRYVILSGGLLQRFRFSEKSALDVHLGTTWHSVDAAIHSFVEFLISTHFRSRPGLDIEVRYDHLLSKNISLFAEANYNYNQHFVDFLGSTSEPYNFQTISLSVGVMYSLF